MTTKETVQTIPNNSKHADKSASTIEVINTNQSHVNSGNTSPKVIQTIRPSSEISKKTDDEVINIESNTMTQIVTQTEANPAAKRMSESTKVLPVDIDITGKVYTINCPAAEVEELEKATTYINSFIQDIRANAPLLTHENLLVLCCLNLYEQIQQSKEMASSKVKASQQAQSLVESMIKDMNVL